MRVRRGEGFGVRIWHELEPLLVHAVVTLVLEMLVILVGGVAKVLEAMFPDKHSYLDLVEKVDIWVALVVLCMFAAYTVVEVALRLLGALRREVRTQFSVVEEEK